jgi:outer membrane protein OmpA-like peptidoglycan-associated protein
MGRNTSSSDAFSRGVAPATRFLAPGRDRFKEMADRAGARKGGHAGDAFAPKPAVQKDVLHTLADAPLLAEREGRLNAAPRKVRTLANGAALVVVASQPQALSVGTLKDEAKRIVRRAAKSSSFVLVSSSNVLEAQEPAVAAAEDGGQGELVIPKSSPAKPKPKAKSGGGGNGGGGGGSGAAPPRDRIFNQDDLAGVLVVLAVLLLMLLYLFRGNSATVEDDTFDVQSASAEPVEPPAPLPDPFGNQAVDLTPKSPAPPEPVVAEVAPPPAPAPAVAPATAVGATPAALDVRVHAYFCTDKSELMPASAEALDKEIAAWGERMAGKDLVVAGYADTRGVAVYNTWLGGERAKAVVNYLTAKGFKATALAVGELPDLADNENCANQRRVDVHLADAPEEAPSRSCTPPAELAALVCN